MHFQCGRERACQLWNKSASQMDRRFAPAGSAGVRQIRRDRPAGCRSRAGARCSARPGTSRRGQPQKHRWTACRCAGSPACGPMRGARSANAVFARRCACSTRRDSRPVRHMAWHRWPCCGIAGACRRQRPQAQAGLRPEYQRWQRICPGDRRHAQSAALRVTSVGRQHGQHCRRRRPSGGSAKVVSQADDRVTARSGQARFDCSSLAWFATAAGNDDRTTRHQ